MSYGGFEKLGEVEAEYDVAARRLEQRRSELSALDRQAIDERDGTASPCNPKFLGADPKRFQLRSLKPSSSFRPK